MHGHRRSGLYRQAGLGREGQDYPDFLPLNAQILLCALGISCAAGVGVRVGLDNPYLSYICFTDRHTKGTDHG